MLILLSEADNLSVEFRTPTGIVRLAMKGTGEALTITAEGKTNGEEYPKRFFRKALASAGIIGD